MLKKLRTICKRPFVMLSSKPDVIGIRQDFPPASVIFCWGSLKKLAWLRWCVPVPAILLSCTLPVTVRGCSVSLVRSQEPASSDILTRAVCFHPGSFGHCIWFGTGQPFDSHQFFMLQVSVWTSHVAAFSPLPCSPRQTSLLLLFTSFIQSLSIFQQTSNPKY